jgi:hypothetical protein
VKAPRFTSVRIEQLLGSPMAENLGDNITEVSDLGNQSGTPTVQTPPASPPEPEIPEAPVADEALRGDELLRAIRAQAGGSIFHAGKIGRSKFGHRVG